MTEAIPMFTLSLLHHPMAGRTNVGIRLPIHTGGNFHSIGWMLSSTDARHVATALMAEADRAEAVQSSAGYTELQPLRDNLVHVVADVIEDENA